jgi:hypothetical protein
VGLAARKNLGIHFTDFFGVDAKVLAAHGAFDISLVGDFPLFVDPFLLFNSADEEHQFLHSEILRYMEFLKTEALGPPIDQALIDEWFTFREVKQNWFGFSRTGNKGHGLGREFASSLYENLQTTFRDFGEETLTESSHIEKLTLIRSGVGRDNISDFTTNLIKGYLARYTEAFAKKHVSKDLRSTFTLRKVVFNYETRSWMTGTYDLPAYGGDFVLLTPKSILTKDEAWINRPEMLDELREIAASLSDEALRAQVNNYLSRVIPKADKVSRKEMHAALIKVAEKFPFLIDYYIREKEKRKDRATSVAHEKVELVNKIFVDQVRVLVGRLESETKFYELEGNTYEQARKRILFLKDVIEKKGGHQIFYVDGKPVQREADAQILYRLTWLASPSDVSREVNDGRGPADFKISQGASDKTLVEFKLAKNSQLRRNLERQAKIYEAASDPTHATLYVIVYFSQAELEKVQKILKSLKLDKSPHVHLIDARNDNKPSGSKA